MDWIKLTYNEAPGRKMHVDINKAFASIEQLCDPHLRGKPVAIAAYDTPRGVIISMSHEAKVAGITVGMRVQDARRLCRNLTVLRADYNKYRDVHHKLNVLLAQYTNNLIAKSIDEFVLDLSGCPLVNRSMHDTAREIKERIRAEVGESLSVSIGISTNNFLAKTAAGLYKPDGLFEISLANVRSVYEKLRLMDLCGIAQNNCARLNRFEIFTVMDFYKAPVRILKAAFQSIEGYRWHQRLHGWEMDSIVFDRKTYGNSYALPQPWQTPEELAPILSKLVQRTGFRMRRSGYTCKGVHVAMLYQDGDHWHQGMKFDEPMLDSRDIYRKAFKLMCRAPHRKPVRALAESVFHLERGAAAQMTLFGVKEETERLVKALDAINLRYGDFVITPAVMLAAKDLVPDRISFGSVEDLEQWSDGGDE